MANIATLQTTSNAAAASSSSPSQSFTPFEGSGNSLNADASPNASPSSSPSSSRVVIQIKCDDDKSKFFNIKNSNNTTIGRIKNVLSQQFKTGKDKIQLSMDSEVISNDEQTIKSFMEKNDIEFEENEEKSFQMDCKIISSSPAASSPAASSPAAKNKTNIIFRDQLGEESFFLVRNDAPLQHLMREYSKQVGTRISSIRFLLDGDRINDDDTVTSLEMKDNDIIDVVIEQQGGYRRLGRSRNRRNSWNRGRSRTRSRSRSRCRC